MKILKGFLASLMVTVILSLSVVSFFAEDVPISEDDFSFDESGSVEDELFEEDYVPGEEKIICEATLEDDFADDTVVVLMKHEDSLAFNEYDADDFSEIEVAEISEITEIQSQNLAEEMADLEIEYQDVLTESLAMDSLVSLNSVSSFSDSDFEEEMSFEAVEAEASRMAFSEVEAEHPYFHQTLEIKLGTHSKQGVLDAIKELEKRDDVYVAEPEYYVSCQPAATPNDSYYSLQWAPSKINLPAAWNKTTGSTQVKVGVIDSGIKKDHPDLQGRVNETLSKSFYEDGSTADELNPFYDATGHGTHVAGIIGAIGNNSQGVTGVCWNVTMVSLKVPEGIKINNQCFINAIQHAIDNGIDIINCSWSTDDSSNALKNTIKNFSGVFVCSAGNDSTNIDTTNNTNLKLYPSRFNCSNIISVAAVDSDDMLADFSNYGTTSVDLAAPGVGIYSTSTGTTESTRYRYDSGTSMACPQVAGVAALLKSYYSNITATGLKKAILGGVDTVSSLSGKVLTGGRLNANKAFQQVENFIQYTVKYDKNGGTGTQMADTTVTYGRWSRLSNNTYSPKTGYKFMGWNAKRSSDGKRDYVVNGSQGWYSTPPTGGVLYLFPNQSRVAHLTTVSGDTITMYAKWNPITYTIYYEKGDCDVGQNMSSQMATYNISQYLSPCGYGKTNHVFTHWTVYKETSSGSKIWLYKNGSTLNYYTQGQQPSGYSIAEYKNQQQIVNLTKTDGDVLHFYPNMARRGDANLNGVLEVVDATIIQKYLAGMTTFNYKQELAADYDEDGNVTLLDVTHIQRHLAGLE